MNYCNLIYFHLERFSSDYHRIVAGDSELIGKLVYTLEGKKPEMALAAHLADYH